MLSPHFLTNSSLGELSQEGKYLKDKLIDTISSYGIIGDTKGNGLIIGIELVENSVSKKTSDILCWKIMRDALDGGLLLLNGGHNVNYICLTPPLVLNKNNKISIKIIIVLVTYKPLIVNISLNKVAKGLL